ncbi:hypothetical protein AVEN_234766-1 [Araneus ventricosus]|uniref:Uncharacterized protein n=1 Tax=Araneus ventricosus TaxID=182803 RepID=A0A4Y2M019_ARAVE|nr:hypothetical protein AVEN_234766-1 [Araneus ventricosus]
MSAGRTEIETLLIAESISGRHGIRHSFPFVRCRADLRSLMRDLWHHSRKVYRIRQKSNVKQPRAPPSRYSRIEQLKLVRKRHCHKLRLRFQSIIQAGRKGCSQVGSKKL